MQLQKIVTLANKAVELQFRVMVRSLRDTGCDLPVLVIPYDDQKFDLPPGCTWWEEPLLYSLMAEFAISPRKRQIQAFLESNLQFADPDIVFLTNPQEVLKAHTGLVTADTEWNKPYNIVSPQSKAHFQAVSSTWQRHCFNSGQWAIDRALYDISSLITTATSEDCRDTCLGPGLFSQPAVNLLAFKAGVKITNLTFPPFDMESTWAGDYPGEFYHLWTDRSKMPYLIHYAGENVPYLDLPINHLFTAYFSPTELIEWEKICTEKLKQHQMKYRMPSLRKRILQKIRSRIFPNKTIA